MPTTLIDLTGGRFGKLTVLGRASKVGYGRPRWVCRCDCGTVKTVLGDDIRPGRKKYRTISCGCAARGQLLAHARDCRGKKGHHTIHGASTRGKRWPEYESWAKMRDRCRNRKHHAWKNYGGRGIKICKRWDDFVRFFQDMGKRPPHLTLDRINNDGNYEPGNCRWATRKQQTDNRRKRKSRHF